MNELALFAGTGGGILGGHGLAWRTVCAVEINAFCRRVLVARQNDGSLPPFPIWDDVRTFDGLPWRGLVDVVSGGFPCQDISESNSRAQGISGARSGLWREMSRIVGEVRPLYVIVENSPKLPSRGLHVVLGDLARLGYDAQWGTLGSVHVGALHRRLRTWIVAADASRVRWEGVSLDEGWKAPERGAFEERRAELERLVRHVLEFSVPAGSNGRVADGVAHRMDRLTAIGNGQDPRALRLAWQLLSP